MKAQSHAQPKSHLSSFNARASTSAWSVSRGQGLLSNSHRPEQKTRTKVEHQSLAWHTLTLLQSVVEPRKLWDVLPLVHELHPSLPKTALYVCEKHFTPSNVNIGCLNPTVKRMTDICQRFPLLWSLECSPAPCTEQGGCPVPSSTQGFLVQRGLTSRKASKLIAFMVAAFLI